MKTERQGIDGFYMPRVYQKNQRRIEARLNDGEIDYADLTQWTFPDEFLCFVLERQLMNFVTRTYPNPGARNDVPIWLLISCQFIMRLHQTRNYSPFRKIRSETFFGKRCFFVLCYTCITNNEGSNHVGY